MTQVQEYNNGGIILTHKFLQYKGGILMAETSFDAVSGSLNSKTTDMVIAFTITTSNCSTGDHIYNISKETLGINNCTDYEWSVHAINGNWEALPLVDTVVADRIGVREWVFSTATGNATLKLQNGTLPYPFRLIGIKLI